MTELLTIATVVFEAELKLLEVQARSFRAHLDPDCCQEILLLDNTVFGIPVTMRRRLLSRYGALADRVTIMRVKDVVKTKGVNGWRSQQAAKLLIARHVQTPHYVVLDAKNHLVGPVGSSDFLAQDGRVHAGFHSYRSHALQGSLWRTLEFLGASPRQIEGYLGRFPVTATPFVFDTSLVKQMILSLELQAGRRFDEIFETEQLTEFLTYSGWVELLGPGLNQVMDGVPIQSPTVWPRDASPEGVTRTLEHAKRVNATFFGVHRQVFARAEPDVLRLVASWWTERHLFPSASEGFRVAMQARRAYIPAMALSRSHERARRFLRGDAG